eukprot:SAG11_NODE_24780_length_368_cov_0.769517_1_plen_86_part_10
MALRFHHGELLRQLVRAKATFVDGRAELASVEDETAAAAVQPLSTVVNETTPPLATDGTTPVATSAATPAASDVKHNDQPVSHDDQ